VANISYTEHLPDGDGRSSFDVFSFFFFFYLIIGFLDTRVERKAGEVSFSDSESVKQTEAFDFICILLYIYLYTHTQFCLVGST